MIADDLNNSIVAGFCAKYHLAGLHQRHLCPLPLGYCNVIGLVSRYARDTEHMLQREKDERAEHKCPSVHFVGAGGAGGGGGQWAQGHGGSGSSNSFGGGGGGGASGSGR